MKRYLVFVLESLSEITELPDSGTIAVKAVAVYLTSADNLKITEECAYSLYMQANPSSSCEIFSVAESFNILQPHTTPGVDTVTDSGGMAPEEQKHDSDTQTTGQYGVTNKPHI